MWRSRVPLGRRLRFRPQAHGLVVLLALLVSVLAGCAPLTDQDQVGRDPAVIMDLRAGGSLGQTFVARHGGLSGIDVWLQPAQPGDGRILLHLRADPGAGADLARAEIPLDAVGSPAFYRFAFPAVPDAHDGYFYTFLEVDGAGAIQAGTNTGNSYLSGALHREHRPADGQLVFRLVYDSGPAGLELARSTLADMGLMAIAGLLWVMPGLALLRLLRPHKWRTGGLDLGDKAGLAAGLSLAVYPLLLLWTDAPGWHLGRWYAWGPVVAAPVILAWLDRPWRRWRSLLRTGRAHWPSEAAWANLALLGAVFIVMAVRLLVVRTLEAPSWGDSVQHAVIAQLINDHNGLFNSWEPYAPYGTLTVQFGFSAATALLSWMTGIETVRATLLTGQLLNGLAILTLYPLGRRIARGNRWAGIGTVITAGLLMSMPAYYVNWGRYAQLAGQVVLPLAAWLLWDFLEEGRWSWPAYGLACVSLAGLALNYYRMPFYYAAFVLAWLLLWALPRWRAGWQRWGAGIARLVMVGLGALLLLLPWALHLRGGILSSGLEAGVGQQAPLAAVRADLQAWRNLVRYVPQALLFASGVTLVWALVRRRWNYLLVGLWTAIMASLVAGRLIGLPGANYLQTFAILIALYIPVGVLSGGLAGEIAGYVARRWPRGGPALVAGLLLALALWGARGQVGIVDRQNVMVTRPDSQAMRWIRDNTPPQARFLVEGFRIYNGRSAVGSDAGWWVPLLAARANTMPPQYAMLNETPLVPNYTEDVVDLIRTLEDNPPASPAGLRALCRSGVTHVYIGQTQGLTGLGTTQLFAPEDFASAPAFSVAYRKDRVHIFALSPDACETIQSSQ